MTTSEIFELLVGARVVSAQAVEHVGRTREDCSTEAVEIILDTGRSTLMSAGTDWTLQVSPGAWPELPGWCWPPSGWTFTKIDRVGGPDACWIREIRPLKNAVDELSGAVIAFEASNLVVISGAHIMYELRAEAPG